MSTFESFNNRLQLMVRRIRRVVGYRGTLDTDDLVNEVIVNMLNGGRLEEVMREKNAGYLARSVRNAILDALRRRKVRPQGQPQSLLDDVHLPDDSELAELVDIHLMRAFIKSEVDTLQKGGIDDQMIVQPSNPERTGKVLRMLLLEERTQRDVAEAFGLGLATVNADAQVGIAYLALRAQKIGGDQG